jgi:glycosyltransferase involved in cell wall biosynthesis
MRLGVVWEPTTAAANYRALEPLRAMERRGHEVVWPQSDAGAPDLSRMIGCDVVHVYRRADDRTRDALTQLVRTGTPLVYDNDDDFRAIPKESPTYKRQGGATGQRHFDMTVKAAKLARMFTTTTDELAERYRAVGVERVEVIGNYLLPNVPRGHQSHDGIVIGWVAGIEHRVDISHIDLVPALKRLLAEYPDVRVECIGVDLGLGERYRHDAEVPFGVLPARIGGWDIAIAPLADIPWNHGRSDIKIKEYAASGVPWLASPVTPYRELGEAQGGRLVPDDGWYDALARLVEGRRDRRKLGRKAKGWAKGLTIDAAAANWERVFAQAAAGF